MKDNKLISSQKMYIVVAFILLCATFAIYSHYQKWSLIKYVDESTDLSDSLIVLQKVEYETLSNFSEADEQVSEKISEIEKIASDYHKQHIYTEIDLFVCTDMSIEIWNLLKSKNISSKICVGNIETKPSNYSSYAQEIDMMNHAWVLAMASENSYVAIETTGGYIVYGYNEGLVSDNISSNYYNYPCFDTPRQFKSFLDLRSDYLNVCQETQKIINYWNENIAVSPEKFSVEDIADYKSRMQLLKETCFDTKAQLISLIQQT